MIIIFFLYFFLNSDLLSQLYNKITNVKIQFWSFIFALNDDFTAIRNNLIPSSI